MKFACRWVRCGLAVVALNGYWALCWQLDAVSGMPTEKVGTAARVYGVVLAGLPTRPSALTRETALMFFLTVINMAGLRVIVVFIVIRMIRHLGQYAAGR
jgi:hypothetical protein